MFIYYKKGSLRKTTHFTQPRFILVSAEKIKQNVLLPLVNQQVLIFMGNIFFKIIIVIIRLRRERNRLLEKGQRPTHKPRLQKRLRLTM